MRHPVGWFRRHQRRRHLPGLQDRRDEAHLVAVVKRADGTLLQIVGFSPLPYEIDFEMSSRRIAKVAEALRETISTTVLFEIKDPRVRNVTVLRTEVSPDLKSARVFVTVMGDEKAQSLAMHGLRSARGFIQSRIADRLELRYTPILQFVLDPGVKMSVQASSIIRDALAQQGGGHVDAIGH